MVPLTEPACEWEGLAGFPLTVPSKDFENGLGVPVKPVHETACQTRTLLAAKEDTIDHIAFR